MRTRSLWIAAVLAALVAPIRADEPTPTQGRRGTTADLVARLKAIPGQAERPFALLVTIRVKPGTQEKFERAARKTAAASRAEKGCLGYECYRNLDDHSEYTIFERWRDVAALAAHLREAHTKAILATMREVAARPARARLLGPVEGGRSAGGDAHPGGDRPEGAGPGGKGRSEPRSPAREKAPDK
jgi:quinol monooxygenase YgiN